jgi:hypothetical protein
MIMFAGGIGIDPHAFIGAYWYQNAGKGLKSHQHG